MRKILLTIYTLKDVILDVAMILIGTISNLLLLTSEKKTPFIVGFVLVFGTIVFTYYLIKDYKKLCGKTIEELNFYNLISKQEQEAYEALRKKYETEDIENEE